MMDSGGAPGGSVAGHQAGVAKSRRGGNQMVRSGRNAQMNSNNRGQWKLHRQFAKLAVTGF